MKLLLGPLLALVSATVGAFADGQPAAHHAVHPVAPTNTRELRSLDVAVSGSTLHLLLGRFEPQLGQTVLLHQRSDDGGRSWSPGVRVDEGLPVPNARGRGTDFQIVAAGEYLTALWLTAGSGFGQRGPLVCARSADGGKTWIAAKSPADDGGDGDHAFMDLTAAPDGTIHAVWLDARDGAGKGLFTARSADHGATWSANRVIDRQTCECCWNVLQADAAGNLFCLYRDLEPRDLTVALSPDAGATWRSLPAAGDFRWRFNGCPHVGGALTIHGGGRDARLHTLVWSGADERAGLYYLTATAPEFAWSKPRRVGGETARHSDLAVSANGQRLAATWTEADSNGASLHVQYSKDAGQGWSAPIAIALPSTKPTHPRVVAVGETFHVFWSDIGGDEWHHYLLTGNGKTAPALGDAIRALAPSHGH